MINVEEVIGKCVGRRVAPHDPLRVSTSTKARAIAWKKALPYRGVPRGVDRFSSHEEADGWLMKHKGPMKR